MGTKVWLSDLGSARAMEVDGRLDWDLGTAAYMAPEQLCTGDQHGPLTDVYALGGTFLYIMSGISPWQKSQLTHTSVTEIAAAVSQDHLNKFARPHWSWDNELKTLAKPIPWYIGLLIQGMLALDYQCRTPLTEVIRILEHIPPSTNHTDACIPFPYY
jgi:serine/threonine protein kinase